MISKSLSKYLMSNSADMLWGVTVNSTGFQFISPEEDYPPKNHPSRYLFSPDKGRTLDEFQFVYITEGSGFFQNRSNNSRIPVVKGDMMLVFPGEWHSYCPDYDKGWVEHWIGCIGEIPDLWLSRGIISKDNPVLHPGLHSRIIRLYEQAAEYASSLKPDYQKALGATAMEILGLALYFDRSNDFAANDSSILMEGAKELIFSEFPHIHPEGVADKLSISYSRFRKLFKSYFGISPGQYILQVKVANAKELLTNTDKQIQEIAWETGFDNSDYFVSAFRRISGFAPGAYRKKTKGE